MTDKWHGARKTRRYAGVFCSYQCSTFTPFRQSLSLVQKKVEQRELGMLDTFTLVLHMHRDDD